MTVLRSFALKKPAVGQGEAPPQFACGLQTQAAAQAPAA